MYLSNRTFNGLSMHFNFKLNEGSMINSVKGLVNCGTFRPVEKKNYVADNNCCCHKQTHCNEDFIF